MRSNFVLYHAWNDGWTKVGRTARIFAEHPGVGMWQKILEQEIQEQYRLPVA